MKFSQIKMKRYGIMLALAVGTGMLSGCNTVPAPDANLAENCDGRAPLTLAEFHQLAEGQTLEQVNAIYGCRGIIHGWILDRATVQWYGGAGRSTSVIATFVFGQLTKVGLTKTGF